MFDTHCHLNLEEFDKTFEKVIIDARDSGVEFFMVPGMEIDSSKKATEIAENFTGMFSAIGVHPTEDLEKMNLDKILIKLEEMSTSPKVRAIGEVGLDYYHFRSAPALQKKFFEAQIKLAVKLDLGLIVHNRASDNDIVDIIEKNWNPHFERRLVFHCFTPEKYIVNFAIKKRIFLGVDGDITYDDKKQKLLKKIPLENIVVETDSPNLVPQPLKSKHIYPNEPKYINLVYKSVSNIKNSDVQSVIKITTRNAKELFSV